MTIQALKHLFVLMMENRSFDHIYGFSGMRGTDAKTKTKTTIDGFRGDEHQLDSNGKAHPITPNARIAMAQDVPHEFPDVRAQLLGPGNAHAQYGTVPVTNSGYLARRHGDKGGDNFDAIRAFTPEKLPILDTLAREFVVCDQWFASMPGPTYPNRMFAHAATCGGFAESPPVSMFVKGQSLGIPFNRGHIFARLRQKKIPWTIYVHDTVENMSVMMDGISRWSDLRDYRNDFARDIRDPKFAPRYVFIEPKYDAIVGKYRKGNSMHPLNDINEGEALIKEVYETLRVSPHWENSALVIVFDEHGGFYDHVPPPAAHPPADGHSPGKTGFDYSIFGPRVPALIVSPLIPKNMIDHTLYDHTSILRTISEWLGTEPLTERDKHANSFSHLFQLATARTDTPVRLPDVAGSPEAPSENSDEPFSVEASAEPFLVAAAIARAKETGPKDLDEIKKSLEQVDINSQADVEAFIIRMRDEIESFGGKESPGEKRTVPVVDAESIARAKAKYGDDPAIVAWSLGITQFELADITN